MLLVWQVSRSTHGLSTIASVNDVTETINLSSPSSKIPVIEFKLIDPNLSFANKGIMEYSKPFAITFLTQCVFKLGLIYCGLASLVFIFVEYKIASGFWWMNGLVFALSDVKTALLGFSILIAIVFGFYCWVNSYRRFVFTSKLSMVNRFFSLCYLSLTTLVAAWLTLEIYQYFLYDPLAGYRP